MYCLFLHKENNRIPIKFHWNITWKVVLKIVWSSENLSRYDNEIQNIIEHLSYLLNILIMTFQKIITKGERVYLAPKIKILLPTKHNVLKNITYCSIYSYIWLFLSIISIISNFYRIFFPNYWKFLEIFSPKFSLSWKIYQCGYVGYIGYIVDITKMYIFPRAPFFTLCWTKNSCNSLHELSNSLT